MDSSNKADSKFNLSIVEIICPLRLSKRYNELYKSINDYVETKLSLDYILKELEGLERMKAYLFNNDELYVLDNIDRFRNNMLDYKTKDEFEIRKFRRAYRTITENTKFNSILSKGG